MMGSVETVEVLVEKLKISSDPGELTELLMHLKTALGHYSKAELSEKVISNEKLMENLFGCLSPNPEDEELVQNAVDILKQLMKVAQPEEILQRYSKDMLKALDEHPLAEVRLLVLAQLSKCLKTDVAMHYLCHPTMGDGGNILPVTRDHTLLVWAVIRQLTFKDLSVANKASKLIVELAGNTIGQHVCWKREFLDLFKSLINSTSSRSQERYRVLETLTNVAVLTAELFRLINTEINLTTILSDLVFDDSDPLGGANALEILAELAGTQFGLEVVTQIGVIKKIERLAQELDTNPFSALLFPEMLKFIGKVGYNQLPPPGLRKIVVSTAMRTDVEIHISTVAIEAMAYMGYTKEGRKFLFENSETTDCFKKARQIIENAQTEFRVRVLDAMTVLYGRSDYPSGGQVYSLGQLNSLEDGLPRWFNVLFPQISTLFGLVQQPFPDLRLSALNFLKAVAPLEWAQRHYLREAGVVEFLLNRDAEPDKECLFVKYEIVCIIAQSPTAAKILSPENYGRLKIYKDQGPFYAEATSAVATEGSS